mmetsp:Transcript_31868/g.105690  ORF Transcript_31868/g.105690 Transcript_31868/m.105690 type:complete len:450 (+) Transcript_31868:68-1417(+)
MDSASPSVSPGEVQHHVQRTPLWTLKATQFLGAAAFACFSRYVTVYYNDIGLSRTQIGILQCLSPFASFAGQLFWGALIDRLGDYKRTLVGTQLFGTVVIFFYMIPVVKKSFVLVVMVTVMWNFLLSTAGPIIDALCLTVLAEWDGIEGYGDQRLWCAVGWGGMALLAGQLIDMWGLNFIFIGFALIQTANICICVIWLPQPKARSREAVDALSAAGNSAPPSLLSFDVLWFLTNLIQYGVAMSLIESFLFVYLIQDFQGTPNVLLGASTAVMCAFEIPVFKYVGRLWKDSNSSLTSVLLFSQLILALRCVLYTILPKQHPWLVLLVEPLHGICFAAMWCAAVEYGQRLTPRGGVARMQALVSGLYYQVSMGTGSIAWGVLVEPDSLGFERSFLWDAVFVVVWSLIWQAGLFATARYRRTHHICAAGASARDVPLTSAAARGAAEPQAA